MPARSPRPPRSSCARSDGLTGQIQRVAAGSARTRSETEALAQRAAEAAAGQADLERAIRELGEVAVDLQRIARHFVVEH